MSIEQAITFVREHGDSVAQARLAYLLHRTPPPTTVIEHLLSNQRADGGWAPFWESDYSSLDATCFRLTPSCHSICRSRSFYSSTTKKSLIRR